MDDLDFDDSFSDLFKDTALVQALALADQYPVPAKSVKKPFVTDSDDVVLKGVELSQALVEQRSVTFKNTSDSLTAKEDDFDDSGLDDAQMLAALESATPAKDRVVTQIGDPVGSITALGSFEITRLNKKRPLAVKFTPWTKAPEIGEEEFSDPDFEDPEVVAALEDAVRCAVRSTAPIDAKLEAKTRHYTEAEFTAILQNAFAAGQANSHRIHCRKYVFRLLDLPAELRLMIYSYALRDSNPKTIGGNTIALPKIQTCYAYDMDGLLGISGMDSVVWPEPNLKPWINTALLRTCKQVYRESRDDVVYKTRTFEARAILNSQWKHVAKEAPKLRFWENMQHLILNLRRTDHRKQWRRHVSNGIEHLVAFLRGGNNLRSFHLQWETTQYPEFIERFKDLHLRPSCSIVVTQIFDDPSVEVGGKEETEREKRLKTLMLRMQGLRDNAVAEYDIITSQSKREGRTQTQIRISTRQLPVAITASNTAFKRRKLTPASDVGTASSAQDTTWPDNSSLTSQPSSPSRAATSSASPEPPRYIPPHLQGEILDAAASNGSGNLSRDFASSSASSPSEAYAGLTLESIEGLSEPTGMTQNRRDSLTLGDDAATTPSNSGETIADDSGHTQSGPRSRSSSPVKRRAAEMDDENGMEGVERIDVDAVATPIHNGVFGKDGDIVRPPTSSNKSNMDRDTRATSVDMLRGPHVTNSTPENSEGTSSASSKSVQSDDVGESEGTGPSSVEMQNTPNLPSIDKQVYMVMEQVAIALKDGEVGYIISNSWLGRVLARSSDKDNHGPYDKDALDGDIGPLDNSSVMLRGPAVDDTLTDDHGHRFVQLKPGLSMGTNFEVFPQSAYDLVIQWYGLAPGQDPIRRYAHATATDPDAFDQHVQVELYPPVFTLRKLRESSGLDKHRSKDAKTKAPRIVASRSNLFQAFLRRAKGQTSIPKNTKVKVWRVLEVEAAGNDKIAKTKNSNLLLSPPASHEGSSRESSPAPQPVTERGLLMDVEAFNNMAELTERELIDMKDETHNEKYNESVSLGTLGLAADQVLILEEQITRAGKEEFVSDRKASNKSASSSLPVGGLLSQGASNSGRSSPVPPGAMTRGRHRSQNRSKGTVGLTNLGNTCYMNSALQCIRANAELTTFFLGATWKQDLNTKNPLGYGGQIAKSYQMLLDAIYTQNNSSFAPRAFKNTLGKYGPQFGGFGQQDSQEFMSFLLDGLHEDLNRIDKKPYIENPDSDDNKVADPEYVKELGETYQTNYRKRNDSVVTDLFSGFYKNTMVCPTCDKVSITFDPYSLLTLQLPIEHSFQHQVSFFPLHGKPILVNIDMDKHNSIRQLKDYVASKIPGLDAKRIMMAEVFSFKFFRTVEDKQTIMEANIQTKDDMILYELDDAPSNFPAPKKKAKYRSMLTLYPESSEEDIPESDSPLSDRMMVPVFFRAQTNSYGSKSLVLTPTFITLKRDEASSLQEIYRKVLSQVANQTTRNFLAETNESSESGTSTPETDQDAVITTDDDAADSSVQTRSIESEDGMVDVLTNGEDGTPSSASSVSTSSILKPGIPIPENLRAIFELKYMPAGSEMISTGWNSVDANKNYATIASRIPKPRPIIPAPESPATSSESSDVDELADVVVPSAQPSFTNDVQSEPEDGFDGIFAAKPSSTLNPRANGNNKRKGKNPRTYSRKENKSRPQTQSFSARRASESSDTVADNNDERKPALLRLGEAIVVDFGSGAYDALFNGDSQDADRGQESKKHAEILRDVELEQKKQKRTARKKHGISLQDCFTATSKGEILTAENAWYCNRCKELRQAEKTLEIWTAPDVLVIHLKRFSANRQFRDKLDVLVDFPVEGLDLTSKVGVNDGKELIYDLFAVDNHYGGLGGGHYTAFAKNFLDDKWYEYNDSSVSQCQPERAITSAAYLLFYRRRTEGVPLGPPAVKSWFNKYWNQSEDNESETSSRAESPSSQGKGQRLGEQTSNGSSTALVVAGAGRRLRGGEGGSAATHGELQRSGTRGVDGYDADADAEDEGLGMDYDDVPIGPQLPPKYEERVPTDFDVSTLSQSSWQGFAGLSIPQEPPYTDDIDGDNDSNQAFDGDEENGGADMRLVEDFGDEIGTGLGHQNSPIMESMEEDVIPDLAESHHLVVDQDMLSAAEEERELFESEAPVAEVRIDDGLDEVLGGSEMSHLKKE